MLDGNLQFLHGREQCLPQFGRALFHVEGESLVTRPLAQRHDEKSHNRCENQQISKRAHDDDACVGRTQRSVNAKARNNREHDGQGNPHRRFQQHTLLPLATKDSE